MNPALIGAGASVIGGIMGNEAAAADRDAAAEARRQALAQFSGIQLPQTDAMELALSQYQSTGQLTPEMMQAIELGETNLADISADPRLRSSQMQALEQLSGLASGRPQAGDMAGFELARQNVAGELQAQNNAVLQNMQQRGQAGSGAELLMKLKNNQVGAQTLANQQMEEAKAMQAARMQALQGQAQMATSLRGQDYSEAANLASARDAIAKYNAANSQNVSNANVGAKNSAQAANLQNAQNIANMNTGVANTQQTHNKGLIQTNFNNQMNLAGAKAGQYNAGAAGNQQNAANTAGMYATIGQGVGQALASFNQPKKTNDKP